MKTRTTLFNWQLPDNYWETGGINCPRKLGGCGRYHSFTIDSLGELEFDLSWETREDECEKFEFYLEDEAREEREEEFKEQFLKEMGLEKEEADQQKRELERLMRLGAGVKLNERQFDKKLGGYRSVGYRLGKKEFFICGGCEKQLKRAGHTGRAKNRNNSSFWGLETEEKILCLSCIRKNFGKQLTNERRKILNRYLKRGYV